VRAVSEGWWRGGGVKNYAHALMAAGKSRACVMYGRIWKGSFRFFFVAKRLTIHVASNPRGASGESVHVNCKMSAVM
jgi:hypothetical protein